MHHAYSLSCTQSQECGLARRRRRPRKIRGFIQALGLLAGVAAVTQLHASKLADVTGSSSFYLVRQRDIELKYSKTLRVINM